MSRPEIKSTQRGRRLCALAAAVATSAGTLLAGCSDLYFDRRDSIALSGGDAVAANAAMQTVDPWPPNSGNTSIAFNGQRMQSAIERYRNNKVVAPAETMTLTVNSQAPASQAAPQTGSSAPANAPLPQVSAQ